MKTFPLGKINIINATPHPIRFQVGDEVVEIPSDPEATKALAAKPVEVAAEQEVAESLGIELVSTKFVGTEEGEDYIERFLCEAPGNTLIVGSIISAQAYGMPVVSLVPVPGKERVPPAEKVYRADKFNVF